MADGWARATHTPGIASATCGPGTTQLATAFVVAARAESPLVAFCGEHPTVDDGYNQRFDNRGFAAACETGFVRLNSPESADDVVRKAFYLARLESRPIMFSAPMDIQQKEFDDDEPYQPSSTILPKRAAGPAPEALERALEIIAAAKKPVIVAGRGARWAGAGDAILKLATHRRIARDLADGEDVAEQRPPSTSVCRDSMRRRPRFSFSRSRCRHRRGREPESLYHRARVSLSQCEVRHSTPSRTCSGECAFLRRVHSDDAKLGVEALEVALAKQSFKQTGYRTAEVKKKLVGHFQDRAEFPIEDGNAILARS